MSSKRGRYSPTEEMKRRRDAPPSTGGAPARPSSSGGADSPPERKGRGSERAHSELARSADRPKMPKAPSTPSAPKPQESPTRAEVASVLSPTPRERPGMAERLKDRVTATASEASDAAAPYVDSASAAASDAARRVGEAASAAGASVAEAAKRAAGRVGTLRGLFSKD